MRLRLDDGYTLSGKTADEYAERGRVWTGLPVVSFDYRPAMANAIYSWQYRTVNAASGAEQLDATCELIAAHVVSWDVSSGDRTADVTADNVRKLPYPILQQLAATVSTWAPKNAGEAAGN